MSEDLSADEVLLVAQRALNKVNDLEDSVDATVNHDDRDEAVIEHLEPGEPVKISRLHKLYRRHTDIRADDTLKQRVRGLVAGPDFRIARAGEILYDPDGGEQR